jgi:tight adherence protein B
VTPVLWAAVGAVALAVAIAVTVVAWPRPPRVGIERLDPKASPSASRLAGAADETTTLADHLLVRTGRRDAMEAALERAGMTNSPAEVLVITAGAALAAAALGAVLGGLLLGIVLALAAPLGTIAVVTVRRSRRQTAFADQLDDALNLMASSLRAGHSVLRAIDAVSRDTEEPTATEFSRVVNETRVGRDVNRALEEVAERTGSTDFGWVVQAIAIHREVGGNLAEVLDRVSRTIRERNQMRRQALALSAEGRLSGVVLLVMPFAVTGFMALTSPDYVARLFSSAAGVVMTLVAAGLMLVGALWLRVIVKVRF